jgi:hypothetical protein
LARFVNGTVHFIEAVGLKAESLQRCVELERREKGKEFFDFNATAALYLDCPARAQPRVPVSAPSLQRLASCQAL